MKFAAVKVYIEETCRKVKKGINHGRISTTGDHK